MLDEKNDPVKIDIDCNTIDGNNTLKTIIEEYLKLRDEDKSFTLVISTGKTGLDKLKIMSDRWKSLSEGHMVGYLTLKKNDQQASVYLRSDNSMENVMLIYLFGSKNPTTYITFK